MHHDQVHPVGYRRLSEFGPVTAVVGGDGQRSSPLLRGRDPQLARARLAAGSGSLPHLQDRWVAMFGEMVSEVHPCCADATRSWPGPGWRPGPGRCRTCKVPDFAGGFGGVAVLCHGRTPPSVFGRDPGPQPPAIFVWAPTVPDFAGGFGGVAVLCHGRTPPSVFGRDPGPQPPLKSYNDSALRRR